MKTLALGEVVELAYGKALKTADRTGGEVPVVGSGGVVGGHSTGITDGPTIVVGRKGSIGSVTWIGGPAWPIDTAYYVKPKSEDLDARWTYWLLRSLPLESMNKSAAVPGLNRDDVYRLSITLPSPYEQRRIAAILDHADALRTKRRQVLAHLASLTQSIFQAMFREVSASRPLSELVEGFRYGTSNKSGAEGYPALRIPNVIGGAIDTSEIKTVAVDEAELHRLRLKDGDLLFVRTNGNPDNVGRSAIFTATGVAGAGYASAPWIYASYLIRARLTDEVLPNFLAAFLASPRGRMQLRERSKTSAGQYNINTEALGSVTIPTVSKDLQREFAERVKRVGTEHSRVRHALAAHDELFDSLQSRAFRGEL